jgi:hypothetical protein
MNVDVSSFDECCKRFIVSKSGAELATGIWCPKSFRVVIDGGIVGFCTTEEELKATLRQEPKLVWTAG